MKKTIFALLAIFAVSISAHAVESTMSGLAIRHLASTGSVTGSSWRVVAASLPRSLSSIQALSNTNVDVCIGSAPASAVADTEICRLIIPAGTGGQGLVTAPMYVPMGYRLSLKVANSAVSLSGDEKFIINSTYSY